MSEATKNPVSFFVILKGASFGHPRIESPTAMKEDEKRRKTPSTMAEDLGTVHQ